MKQTFNFLKALKSNNNREWFAENRHRYEKAREEFGSFMEKILNGIRKFDKDISKDAEASESVYRIYRDIRFSKDKTPYKTFMSASINPGGRKSPEAGYYIQVQPGGTFVAGGIYNPDPAMLKAIRQEIDYNAASLLKIMKAPAFRKHFSGLDDEDKLQTVPKGYDKNHPQIDLLKNRHFLVSRFFPDNVVLKPGFVKTAVPAFEAMYPLMKFLRTATAG